MQVRVLGCLIEKERTTPDNYPLTVNALLSACNQTTNRYPVVSFTEATVSNAVQVLRADNLLRIDYSRSGRADKYRHVLDQVLDIDEEEISLLGVLMLRGPQTAAELRSRVERMHAFESQAAVDTVLNRLAARPDPLVVRLAPMPGQKESRWAHLLAGPVSVEDIAVSAATAESARTSRTDRLEALEARVEELAEEVRDLRAQLQSFL